MRTGLRSRLEFVRSGPRRGIDRVRTRWLWILHTAFVAGVAWEVARLLQPRPYFAPVAAVIALGAASGQHLRRAIELSFGVALGIFVADLLLSLVPRSGLTLFLLVSVTMAAAYLFGVGQILVNQAAVSAVILATIGTQPGTSSFTRFFSALIGVTVALVLGPVFVRRDPLGQVGHAATRVLEKLADVLDKVASALEHGDSDEAAAALQMARASNAELEAFEDAVAAAQESLRR
jgi:uncharacterized membrane protein YgaE (UPF0421/DUF939 family)